MTKISIAATPKTISHYTTLEGLKGIIQSGSLWASNASYLNDRAELQHALKASKRAIEKITTQKALRTWGDLLKQVFAELEKGGIPDTYVACFCRDNDNLSQWRGYGGKVQGVSVTFDRPKLASRFKPEKATFFKVRYSKLSTASKLSDALTSELHDIADLNEILGAGRKSEQLQDLHGRISALLPRFKHLGFQDEKEWRFVIQRTVAPEDLCFRVSDNKLVPYIEIGKLEAKLPILSVRIGPGPDQELTAQSVRLFLAAKGYHDVEVSISDVPFRP